MTFRSASILICLSWPAVTGAAEGASPADLVKRGNAALASGNYDQALSDYREAEVGQPESDRIKYNEGLVHYRKGDFVKARELLTESLSTRDLKLEAAAHYNLGNCAYRQALEKLKAYDAAIKLAREAIGYYRQALELQPQDDDARANIEMARLQIKDLQDKKKKEEEEKKKQPQSQPSSQPQSQPSSQPQPESQPSSQPKQQDGQDKKKQQQQKQQGQQDQQKKQEQKAGAKQQAKQRMSKEEARRLLQAVRDKERERRREQVRKQAVGRVGVDKDW